MNLKDLRKERKGERKAISRKIRAGQSFRAHLRENSVFDERLLKRSRIIMIVDGEKIEIRPENNDKAPPQWHQEVIDERMQLFESGESVYTSLSDLKKL